MCNGIQVHNSSKRTTKWDTSCIKLESRGVPSPFLWHSLHTCPDTQIINVEVFLNTSKMELTTCVSTPSLGFNAKCFHANTRFTL